MYMDYFTESIHFCVKVNFLCLKYKLSCARLSYQTYSWYHRITYSSYYTIAFWINILQKKFNHLKPRWYPHKNTVNFNKKEESCIILNSIIQSSLFLWRCYGRKLDFFGTYLTQNKLTLSKMEREKNLQPNCLSKEIWYYKQTFFSFKK